MTCRDCDRPVRARGLCAAHYGRARRAGDLIVVPHRWGCLVDGCPHPHHGRGLCKTHHMQTWRAEAALRALPELPRDDDFWAQVDACLRERFAA